MRIDSLNLKKVLTGYSPYHGRIITAKCTRLDPFGVEEVSFRRSTTRVPRRTPNRVLEDVSHRHDRRAPHRGARLRPGRHRPSARRLGPRLPRGPSVHLRIEVVVVVVCDSSEPQPRAAPRWRLQWRRRRRDARREVARADRHRAPPLRPGAHTHRKQLTHGPLPTDGHHPALIIFQTLSRLLDARTRTRHALGPITRLPHTPAHPGLEPSTQNH